VYAKPPLGGAEHVLQYLARYTHRVAISNHRLLAVTDATVTFRWKDYAHASRQRSMTLSSNEFLRRFLQHVLPKGFPRIRYFGWMANRRKRLLVLCRSLLHQPSPAIDTSTNVAACSVRSCPRCSGPMYVIQRLTAAQIYFLDVREESGFDSS
jgi:hypothetical protein